MRKRYFLLSAALCFSMMVFAGCGDKRDGAEVTESPAAEETLSPEETDRAADDAVRDGEEALDDAGDATRDAVDDTGDVVKDAVDDAGDMMDDAARDTEDAVDDGTAGNGSESDYNNSVTSGKKR